MAKTFEHNFPEFYSSYKEAENKVGEIIGKTIIGASKDMMGDIIANTPVDTGHAVDNWRYFKGSNPPRYEIGDRDKKESISTEFEKDAKRDERILQLFGEMQDLHLNVLAPTGKKATRWGIVCNTSYILNLEYQASPQAPHGIVAPVAKNARDYVTKAVIKAG